MLVLLATSLSSAPWSLIFMIVSLICLLIAAFITGSTVEGGPFYRRLNWGWAGMFFFVLAVALGGK